MAYTRKNCVFIRGAARTWNYLKHNSIAVLQEYYNNPDFYVLMTNNGTVSLESLQQDFNGVNAVCIKLISHNEIVPFGIETNSTGCLKWQDFSTNYWRMAWYDYVLELEKRKYEIENNIRYSFTQFVRPDLLLRAGTPPEVDDMVQDLHGIVSDNVYNIDTDSFRANDIVYVAGSRASTIHNFRYFDSYYTDGIPNQMVIGDPDKIAEYLFRNHITFPKKTFGAPGGPFLRPSSVEYYQIMQGNLDVSQLYKLQEEWQNMNVEQRQYHCDKVSISHLDYSYRL